MEAGRTDPVTYDGSWERKGRSTATAAVAGLLGIGFVYFQGQSILLIVFIVVSSLHHQLAEFSGDFLERLTGIAQSHKAAIWSAVAFSQYLFMLVPTLWLVKRWHSSDVGRYIRMQKTSVPAVLLAVVSVAVFLPANVYLGNLFMRILRIPENLIRAGTEIITARSTPELVFLVAEVALTPAICEEVFFRGFAQRTLERSVGAGSVWIMGITFGLFHMRPLGLLTLSAIGIALGYFYYRSGSIIPSMAAHFTNNLLVVLFYSRSPQIAGFSAALERISLPWTGITLVFSATTIYLFHLATRSARPGTSTEFTAPD